MRGTPLSARNRPGHLPLARQQLGGKAAGSCATSERKLCAAPEAPLVQRRAASHTAPYEISPMLRRPQSTAIHLPLARQQRDGRAAEVPRDL